MNSIQVSSGKTLKLVNALSRRINEDELSSFSVVVKQMENYALTRGAQLIGPLIQHVIPQKFDDGTTAVNIYLIRQCNQYIVNTESPYRMDAVLRIKDCLYAHYCGPESKLRLANSKLEIYAFEHGFEIKSDNYLIFLDQQGENIVADVFAEIQK